jgi:hypothetical protein
MDLDRSETCFGVPRQTEPAVPFSRFGQCAGNCQDRRPRSAASSHWLRLASRFINRCQEQNPPVVEQLNLQLLFSRVYSP